MFIVADFTVVPIGVGVSLSQYIAEVSKVVEASGLNFTTHSCGTNIEGEYDDVMKVIKECHAKLHSIGVPRVHTSISLGSRTDKPTTIKAKLDSLNSALKSDQS